MKHPTNALMGHYSATMFCCDKTAELQSQIIQNHLHAEATHSFLGAMRKRTKKQKYYKALLALACFTCINVTDLNAKPQYSEQKIAANLTAGVATTAPIGYREMCADQPTMCQSKYGRTIKAQLSDKKLNEINMINLQVNISIKPVTDMDHWGVVEKWSLPEDGAGDCEDYVLLKRKILMEKGWAEENLLITVVRDHKNEGHAILTVVTDKGDLILDNHNNDVKLWHETGYTFIKRQSQELTSQWVSLRGVDQLPTVASNRR